MQDLKHSRPKTYFRVANLIVCCLGRQNSFIGRGTCCCQACTKEITGNSWQKAFPQLCDTASTLACFPALFSLLSSHFLPSAST